MPALIVLLVGSAVAAVDLTGGPAEGIAGMAALAVLAAGVLLLALAVALRAVPVPTAGALSASAVRRRRLRTDFLPVRDPAAPGRSRPRAPSAQPRVA